MSRINSINSRNKNKSRKNIGGGRGQGAASDEGDERLRRCEESRAIRSGEGHMDIYKDVPMIQGRSR